MPFADPSLYPSPSLYPGDAISEGLLLSTVGGVSLVAKYVGEPNLPGEVTRRRRTVYDAMRRFGTPVLVKHRYNDLDVINGVAAASPAFDDVYGQVPIYDDLSHGVGFCSVENSTNEWYETTTGTIVTASTSPGAGYAAAPRYRGYGPGYLTFIIEPDTALDYFRLSPIGALIKVQSAQAQAPWFPSLNDNDLLVHVELDELGQIVSTSERYELKMTSPTSVRGSERRGRRENGAAGGNRYVVNQTFEMALVPDVGHPVYSVETDR